MKILNISNSYIWPGGENRGIPSIFMPQKEFVERGHEVHFLYPHPECRNQGPVYRGIYMHAFNFPFNFSGNKSLSRIRLDKPLNRLKTRILYSLNWLFFQFFGFVYLFRLARQLRPDIIYAHFTTTVLPAWIVSKILSIKLIVRIYGLNWQDEIRYWLCRFREYFVFKVPADYFIITNDGTAADQLAKKLGVSAAKIKYWRNGVDFSLYQPQQKAKLEICKMLNLKLNTKIILSLSRINFIKGVDRLVAALPLLFSQQEDCICIVANHGPDREKLEEYVRRHKIERRVFFLGNSEHSLVRDLLNAADIFIALARNSNCSNVVWEAMACGKCIVTIEKDSIKEILTSGENAILLREDEVKKLPEIMAGLLNDSELRDKLGAKARSQAQKVLESWPERAKKEIILLEKLMEEK